MNDVLTATERHCGRITLNRPQSLNALSLAMIQTIAAALSAWRTDDAVQFILIEGAGARGLCAGGDIRALYNSALASSPIAREYFRAEYRLNAQIAAHNKPIVALMDGIVMGGGIGISAHASHRIVTERSVLAMPETGIGFIPDVGSSYLLSRKHLGEFGTHIALATPRLNADDAMAADLADYFVPSADLPDLRAAFLNCADADHLEATLSRFTATAPAGDLRGARDWIDSCYAHDNIEAIINLLQAHPAPQANAAARDILAKSPISLKQTLRLLRQARATDALHLCLEREYIAAVQITALPDFIEGVRAAVVDKDRNPRWSCAHPNDVTEAMLDHLFPATIPGLPALFDAG